MDKTPEDIALLDPDLQMLLKNEESGYAYLERRLEDWDDNYLYYRMKPVINRLLQRQSVHIPITKQTIKTLIKDMDDMPILQFQNLDNDKQAEIFFNEYWKETVKINYMELQDIVDKKQDLLYGRTYDQWQIVDGKIKMTVIDPYDIRVSKYTDPYNIHSSRFLIHTNIYVPISTLENNADYNMDAIARLKEYYATEMGFIKAEANRKALDDKNQRLSELGVTDLENAMIGETYCMLTLHFVYRQEEGDEQEQIYLFVEADKREILFKKKLEEVIDPKKYCKDHFWRNHYPYVSWADDLDRSDWYTDAVGDIVRAANQQVDVAYSQWFENRTLRGLSMKYYDGTFEGFNPQTYTPGGFKFFSVPGDPNKIIKDMDIAELGDSVNEMKFILENNEKATGATPALQGMQAERDQTLGQEQGQLMEAKKRVKSSSKFYNQAWNDRGLLFMKLMEAGRDRLDSITIYKKGRNTDNMYSREISPKDYLTSKMYHCKVWSQDEKDMQNARAVQGLDVASIDMPDNPKLAEIRQRKKLELAGLNPDEIADIMEYERQKREALINGMLNGAPGGIMPGTGLMPGGQVIPGNSQTALPKPKPATQ